MGDKEIGWLRRGRIRNRSQRRCRCMLSVCTFLAFELVPRWDIVLKEEESKIARWRSGAREYMGSLNEGFIFQGGRWLDEGWWITETSSVNLVGRVRQQKIRLWTGDSIWGLGNWITYLYHRRGSDSEISNIFIPTCINHGLKTTQPCPVYSSSRPSLTQIRNHTRMKSHPSCDLISWCDALSPWHYSFITQKGNRKRDGYCDCSDHAWSRPWYSLSIDRGFGFEKQMKDITFVKEVPWSGR